MCVCLFLFFELVYVVDFYSLTYLKWAILVKPVLKTFKS